MRILWENRFIDSRFTGKKFLKAERMKMCKKMGMLKTSPIKLTVISAGYISSSITSMTYRCSL